jgi:hypothetical protein
MGFGTLTERFVRSGAAMDSPVHVLWQLSKQ